MSKDGADSIRIQEVVRETQTSEGQRIIEGPNPGDEVTPAGKTATATATAAAAEESVVLAT